ncbi:hypothetical protein D0Y65_026314 [Glycine soja]|uniref:GIR1-like zinc ribbon domain-containing protein n=1 Tax=Glycine soja TaxID=3848 RepID=A0A445IJG8_GLYSO|nr:hypothetical protein D0Y65_026314 [Glycine soja]
MSDKKRSTSNHGLNMNIPPPRVANHIPDSPTRLPIAPPTSPSSSCVSNELSQDDNSSSSSNKINNCGCTQSPEDISMVLVGCSRCLMYMMVNEDVDCGSGGCNIDDNCGFGEDGSRCIGGDRGSSVGAYDCEPYFSPALFFSVEASSSSQLFFPAALLLRKCSSSSSQVVFFFFATARVLLHRKLFFFFPILKCLFLQPNHDCCSPSKDVLCALLFSIKGSENGFVSPSSLPITRSSFSIRPHSIGILPVSRSKEIPLILPKQSFACSK